MMGADRDPNTGVSLLPFTGGASGSSEAAPCRESGDIGSGRSDPAGCCTWLGGDCRMGEEEHLPTHT